MTGAGVYLDRLPAQVCHWGDSIENPGRVLPSPALGPADRARPRPTRAATVSSWPEAWAGRPRQALRGRRPEAWPVPRRREPEERPGLERRLGPERRPGAWRRPAALRQR